MKKIFTLLFSLSVLCSASAQYAHQNIDMLGNFDDPNVQPEFTYGIRYQSCWGYVDSLGNEYGIIGSTAGTYIVNVTNPSNPVQHTYIPLHDFLTFLMFITACNKHHLCIGQFPYRATRAGSVNC